MGLNTNVVKLLLHLKAEGVTFGKVLTLGRQRLNLSKRALRAFGYQASAARLKAESRGYAEGFLHLLGAEEVQSMDVSGYEKATLIHDLNDPIPAKHRQAFDTLIDSGTLEHIFNFPVAIKNCMQLLKEGGCYIGITPCNNFFGHGFYQFSPELYYRVFSEENGFSVRKMYFFVDDKNTGFYEINDPAVVRERITMANARPSFLMVVASKLSDTEVFSVSPQQSDYENIIWKNQKTADKLRRFLPKPLRRLSQPFKKWTEGLALIRSDIGTGDTRFFKRVM